MFISIITKAWVEVAKGNTTSEQKRRSSICKDCPSAKFNTIVNFVKDELTETKGMVCSDCGCPLSAKIRSTDKCYKW